MAAGKGFQMPVLSRRRKMIIPLLVGGPIICGLLYFVLTLEPEPLSPREILEKKEWSQKELSRTMGHVFSPQSNRRKRDEVIKHLRGQLKRFPADQQRQIRAEALQIALHNGVVQMRALPPERRKQMIDKMQHDAERNYEAALKRNGTSRKEVDKFRHTAEFQEFSQEISTLVLTELTTNERREYNGLIKTWVKIMQLP